MRPSTRRWSRRSGGAVSLELVIATPVLLLLITLVVQFALWQNGVGVAQAAAQQGLAAARVQGGTDAAGAEEANHVLTVVGGAVVVNPQVTVTRTAGSVQVEVVGHAEQVVPFLQLPIEAHFSGPIEAFPATTGGP
jgi:Flp pilus assembly protein TadG